MQLFFNPDVNENTSQITFDREESKHIVKVLRKSVGDDLHITNGKGWLFIAEITLADIKNCIATITSKTFKPERKYNVHIAVAPTKMNDRYEWFLEKATEIGIDTITPIICDHSERKVIKIDRFEKILQSAMKQSLHYYMPKLNNTISFKEFVKQEFTGQKFIAHCEETDKKSFKNEVQPNQNILILIGPEGDFTKQELDYSIQKGFSPIKIGPRILRTETAPICILSILQYKYGDIV